MESSLIEILKGESDSQEEEEEKVKDKIDNELANIEGIELGKFSTPTNDEFLHRWAIQMRKAYEMIKSHASKVDTADDAFKQALVADVSDSKDKRFQSLLSYATKVSMVKQTAGKGGNKKTKIAEQTVVGDSDDAPLWI